MQRTIIILTLLTFLTSAYGTYIYVSPGQSIQSAIDAATNGSNIIVSPGRYKENINFSGKAIKLTSLDSNNPSIVELTIIDGNNPADSNFASTVTFNSGENNDSILAGFTITGGSGTWLLLSWESRGLNWSRCGGGIACYNKSEPTIMNNIIKDNIAGLGGGICIYGDPVNPDEASNPAIHVKPVINNNIFINNNAIMNHGFIPPDSNHSLSDRGDGGAIACFQGSDAVIKNNSISQNYAKNYGGGIYLQQWSNALINNNQINDNNSLYGGGINATYICSPVITENIISSNTARGAGGGGISLYFYSSGTIKYNSIIQNKAIWSKGGGIGVFWNSNILMENNIIGENSSLLGGGVYVISGSADLKNNTIATNSSQGGSGIYISGTAEFTAKNNIMALNSGSAQIYKDPPATLNASYNDVWSENNDNFGGDINDFTGINGNISEDPKLASVDTNDFTLTVYSPCINAGDSNFVPALGQKDINGDDRLIGQYIDIGADEAWPVWNITNHTKYEKIQDAINDSNFAETVIVGRGRYYENIDLGAHQLILSSADPNRWDVVEKTIIDADQTGTAVVISGGQDANTILRGFTVTNGSNSNGGGIVCEASPIIEKNIITKCSAENGGGGLYFANEGAKPIVNANLITKNTAEYGGGLACESLSEVTLTENYFNENTSSYVGGAIYCYPTSNAAHIKGNHFIFNKALVGGAITSEQSDVNSFIHGNIFAGNTAQYGGALALQQTDPDVINNTFISNRATDGTGTIIMMNDSNPTIANNIIAHSDYGYGIYSYTGNGYTPSNPVILNNDLYDCDSGNYGGGLTDKTGINGNISVDPNVVHAGYWMDTNTPSDVNDDTYLAGNYHIMPDSPCVNAGDNSSVPALLTSDIDDEQRIYEAIVDMGADEAVKNPFDLNIDGIVDYYELSILKSEWLTTGIDLQTDFYSDDNIDFRDLTVLSEQWMWKGGWYDESTIPEPPKFSKDGSSFDSYAYCVAHWKLDESSGTIASEEIGSYNGTLNSFPTNNSQWVAALLNNGLEFDGTNDYVSTNFNFLKTADNFTIALWFKADDTSFGRHIIWQGDSTGNGWGAAQEMHISLGNYTMSGTSENNKLAFFMISNNISTGKSLHITTNFSDTTNWHFVAVTVQNLSSSPQADMYLDGIMIGTDTMDEVDLDRSNWNTSLRFGRPGSSERYFNGKLDNILVYDKVLTESEINELYNAVK